MCNETWEERQRERERECKCNHCDGTGKCNCDECRNQAGLDPRGTNKVICKACDGSGRKDRY